MSTESPRRLAVFSDIHGNLQALDAVLAAIDEMGIRNIVCCGDVVGYGADPNQCCERLRERGIPTVVGNHDHAALGKTDISFFNEIARDAILWTRRELNDANMSWLEQLPFTLTLGDQFYFVHASPHNPESWGYVLTFGDARVAFAEFSERVGFIGHSHQPAIVEQSEGMPICPEGVDIPMHGDCRYLVNVGSVGQPRDQNPQACFVTVDLDEQRICFHRIVYDVDTAARAIDAAGLPPELSERIRYGW